MNKLDQIIVDDQVVDAAGYILDEIYVTRYFDLQSPQRMRYSMLSAGFQPGTHASVFSYCELGCGNGLTTCVLALLHPEAQFFGIDINPQHIANAEIIAKRLDLHNITFIRADLADYSAYNFPDFDYITVHGVYSWVNETIRDTILTFIQEHLSATGTAYISYNAMPGWAAKEPVWRMVNRYASMTAGNSLEKVSAGLGLANHLASTGAEFFRQIPAALEHLDFLNSEEINYVSHEYCNAHLKPVYASDAFAHAASFGLKFVAQAETCYNLEFERAAPQHLAFIQELREHDEKEIWASLLRNDSFRTDMYAHQLPMRVSREDNPLWDMVFTNIVPREDLPGQLECGSRIFDKNDPMIAALIQTAESGELSLREICGSSNLWKFPPRLVFETVQLLELSGCFAFMQGKHHGSSFGDAIAFSQTGIRTLLEMSMGSGGSNYLAAPRLGTAIEIGTVEALALLALTDAPDRSEEILARSLNDNYPDVLGFSVDSSWAGNYISYFRLDWIPLLKKLEVI